MTRKINYRKSVVDKINIKIKDLAELKEFGEIIEENGGLKRFNYDGYTGDYQVEDFKDYERNIENLHFYFYYNLSQQIVHGITHPSAPDQIISLEFFKNNYTRTQPFFAPPFI